LRRFAVSDVHGHRDDLVDALRAAGLVDDAGDWSGDDATLWVLGDYVDRGPDGVGVIDVVMRLQQQAPRAGGRVGALMGNHEVLALGMHRFGDAIVRDADGHEHAFTTSWALNGGRPSDQARLTPEHVAWLAALPAVARDGDWLLTHSDTTEYLGWGSSVAEVNARVAGVTAAGDLEAWWDLWRGLTTRFAFRGPGGVDAAEALTGALGGERIVHGHSIIATLTGELPSQTTGPLWQAGGRALAIDGGRYAGGPLLLVRLDEEEAGA